VEQPYKLPHHVWNQLKSITPKELLRALEKDPNWTLVRTRGSAHYFHNPQRPSSCQEVAIHVHPQKGGYGPKMLKGLLETIGWTEDDLRKLKLIK
jgi:predicted RNA binding protein YcfA (HicA-like mRNA interferase family)